MMNSLRTATLAYFFGLLLAATVALVYLYPFQPVTVQGGLVWLALGLPVVVFLERIGSLLFHQRVSDTIDSDTSKFFTRRALYALLVCMVLLGAMGTLIGFSYEQFGAFIEANYSSDW